MKIYYPEDYSLISVARNGEKVPVMRFVLPEESEAEPFTNNKVNYDDRNFRVNYKLVKIEQYEETASKNPLLQGAEDSVILTLVDADNTDNVIYLDLFVQDFFAALLLSQTLKTPLLTLVPSDDIQTLQKSSLNVEELKIIVTTPDRKSNEYKNITKTLAYITKETTQVKEISIPSKEIDKVRGRILNIITGLIRGDAQALIETSNYVTKYDNLYKKISPTVTPADLSEEEANLLFMKEALIRLENETHPITLAGMFSETEVDALQYIDNALEFEKIMKENKINTLELSVLDHETITVEDAVKFLNTKIDATPEPLASLIQQTKLKYVHKYDWTNPLEDNVDFNTLDKPGDFLASLIIAIASRLAKMLILYNKMELSNSAHPLAILISSLTMQGESYRWAAKHTTETAILHNATSLKDFIHITTNPKEPLNGALGMLLHGIGHILIDGKITLQQAKIVLKNYPNVYQYLESVESAKSSVPSALTDMIGEAVCFIPSLILPELAQNFIYNTYNIESVVESTRLLSNAALMKETQSPVGSDEWNEHARVFVNNFVK